MFCFIHVSSGVNYYLPFPLIYQCQKWKLIWSNSWVGRVRFCHIGVSYWTYTFSKKIIAWNVNRSFTFGLQAFAKWRISFLVFPVFFTSLEVENRNELEEFVPAFHLIHSLHSMLRAYERKQCLGVVLLVCTVMLNYESPRIIFFKLSYYVIYETMKH